MTLTKKDLRRWEKSAFILFTAEQERQILEIFGSEPEEGYEWTEQDIAENVRKICKHCEKSQRRAAVSVACPGE